MGAFFVNPANLHVLVIVLIGHLVVQTEVVQHAATGATEALRNVHIAEGVNVDLQPRQ